MGTTPNGLPYPEPTDPVAQGAAAIKALATALDPYGPNRPRGMLSRSAGPAGATDYGGVGIVAQIAGFPTKAGRSYMLTAYVEGTQQGAAGVVTCRFAGDPGAPTNLLILATVGAGGAAFGTAVATWTEVANATRTYQLTAAASAGAFRVQPNTGQITLVDITLAGTIS